MKARLFSVYLLVVTLALSLTWAGAAQELQPPTHLVQGSGHRFPHRGEAGGGGAVEMSTLYGQICSSPANCGGAPCIRPGCPTPPVGVCGHRPIVCPMVWLPVCGCNGVTYSNECFAAAAGVDVACYRECPCSQPTVVPPARAVELVGQIGCFAYTVAISGTLAYIGVGPRLVILDVSDPAHPTVIGQTGVLPDVILGVAVVGNYAYVADYDSGLYIINVSDPACPSGVGFYDTSGSAWGVAVAGTYAYVADGSSGLRIINVANPAAPTEAGFYDTSEYAYGVVVAGNYAYVADGSSGLRIIDVANPAAPSEVGFYDTPGYAWGMTVGNYAYVADEDKGLRIVDIADPTHPNEVGFYDTPGYTRGVAVAGNHAYVADGSSGLRIINVADPTHPTEVGFYDTPGWAQGVAVVGNYAYVADMHWGLVILRFYPHQIHLLRIMRNFAGDW
jgi:hypothetical protein